MKRVMLCVLIALVVTGTGCTKSPELRKQQALERGRQHLANKDYARAVLEFKNAVQSAPSDAEAHYQLAVAYLGSQDVRGAVAELRKATELRPGFAEAQIKLSNILSGAQSPEVIKDAVQRMETVLAVSPENPDALSTLAVAEFRLGDHEDAEKHLVEALESAPSHLKAAVALARLKLSQKKIDEAETVLRKAADQNPPSATSLVVLGGFYVGMKRPLDAKRQFTRALQADPSNGVAMIFLGSLQLTSGDVMEAEKTYKRLSELPDKQYRPMYAAFLFQTGKRDAGIEELKRLIAVEPGNRDLRRRLVSAYLRFGRVPEAEQMLTAALKQNAKDTDALTQRSSILLLNGRYDEANNDINQVLQYEPNSAQAHYILARIHEQRGNVNSRRAELAQALRLNPEFLAARLELAKVLLDANAAKSALEIMDETPDDQKKTTSVIAGRNWILLSLGKKDEVQKELTAAGNARLTTEMLLQDAVLKLDKREFDAARSTLTEVLQKAPEDTRALDLIMRSYNMQGQSASGIRKVREHVAAHASSARLQHHLGVWLRMTGATMDARSAFEAAHRLDESFWPASLSLASINLSENRVNDATNLLKPLLSHSQAGLQAHALLASAEQSKGNHSASIEHLRKMVTAQPDNILALNNLAYALAEYGNSPDEALKFAERAKELAPDNATIDDTLGWVLYRRGLHGRAAQHLQNAVKKQPTAVRHAHLALAYAAKGDVTQGIEQLRAAMKMNPDVPEVAAAQKALSGR